MSSKIGLMLLYIWVEIRGREERENITRKSTNGQERENDYTHERRNINIIGTGKASSEVQREFPPNVVPFVQNVSTTTLLYTAFISTILFP